MIKFSRTIRQHMRDPKRYTPEKCWTAEESRLADTLLARLREQPGDTLEEGLAQLCKRASSQGEDADTSAVLTRLHQFPHIFELADARHDLGHVPLPRSHKCAISVGISPCVASRVSPRWARWTQPPSNS